MPKEFFGRFHGDGGLGLPGSVDGQDSELYSQVLTNLLDVCKLNVNFTEEEKTKVLLALKQRLAIAFSNGCPFPERAMANFINKQDIKPDNAEQLTEYILESMRADAQCNYLYSKVLMKYANHTLRSELMLLKPMDGEIEGQEDRNVPPEMSEQKLVAGMAYDLVFVDVLLPLRDLINQNPNQQETFNEVTRFLMTTSQKATSIEALIVETKQFLNKSH